MKHSYILICLLFLFLRPQSQTRPSSGKERVYAFKKQMGLSAKSPYRDMKWRFVGDLFIHPRDLSVVISTYGRGIWVLDDVSALRQVEKLFENYVNFPTF